MNKEKKYNIFYKSNFTNFQGCGSQYYPLALAKGFVAERNRKLLTVDHRLVDEDGNKYEENGMVINEKTIKRILAWLDERVQEEKRKMDGHKKLLTAFYNHRNKSLAFDEALAFIEDVTGIKLEDVREENP